MGTKHTQDTHKVGQVSGHSQALWIAREQLSICCDYFFLTIVISYILIWSWKQLLAT